VEHTTAFDLSLLFEARPCGMAAKATTAVPDSQRARLGSPMELDPTE